ncbi:MAG: pilin, partial [Patescibacteria group bacterium]
VFLIIIFFQISANTTLGSADCGTTQDTIGYECKEQTCSNFFNFKWEPNHCSGKEVCGILRDNKLGDYTCIDISTLSVNIKNSCISNLCTGSANNLCCPTDTIAKAKTGSAPEASGSVSVKSNTVVLLNPLTGTATSTAIPEFLGKIIHGVLGIVGSLALVMFIYGGLLWMTSAGKADQVTKGRDSMLWAAIGIIVIFSAYALVNLVLTTIKPIQTTSQPQ